jgi:hypothetical protein
MLPRSIDAFMNLPDGGRLVFEFFVVFSRLEYALKRAGYLKKSRFADPDWDSFAMSLCGSFRGADDHAFQIACRLLLDRPPKIQINVNGELDWKATQRKPNETDEQLVLRLVRIVRNNLFHGGKFRCGPAEEPARDQQLLESSILVLKHCLAGSPTVRAYFDEVG